MRLLPTAITALYLTWGLVQAAPRPQSLSASQSSVAVTVTSASVAPSTSASVTAQNPCAAISQIYAQANITYTNIRVPAQLAIDCLNDVPLDTSTAVTWLNSLRPYIEWQTTLAYLKNPPSGYPQPPFDVYGYLDSITAGVTSGKYANEYQFEYDIYKLFQSAYDGHFRYLPSLPCGIFAFGRPLSLVSYSIDGTADPKPYVYSDVLSYFTNGTAAPSAITLINGQDAVTYLVQWAQLGVITDPDALYNNVFYELGQVSLGSTGTGAGTFAGAGRGAYNFPGANTTLTFENGTTTSFPNFARLLVPFRNITNGQVLYKTWVNPFSSSSSSNSSKALQAAATDTTTATSTTATKASTSISLLFTPTGTPRPGYPSPVLSQLNNYVGGWYLNASGYEDVAVLGVQSFSSTADYQNVVYNFLDMASKAGKTKLVIDTSGNGGGAILQGYNMFLNLFPGVLPYGATRYRNHEAFNIIGETVSDRITTYPYNFTKPPAPVWRDFEGGSPYNYRADVDINYQNFNSWREKDPPNTFYGDNFTSIIRWNLSDPSIQPANGIQINGYGNRTGLPPTQPFKPENIVILYDGYCASTCAIFSELMTQQGGVKTIAIGGRPNKAAPMQAVGGTRGTTDYTWQGVYEYVTDMYVLAPDLAGYFNASALYSYINPATYEIPYLRGVLGGGTLNVRDGIRRGDASQTPLQFIYEPADCRIYYTAEMTVHVTAMWEKAADVAWGGDACVQGSVFGGSAQPSKRDKKPSEAKREERKARAAERLRKRLMSITPEDAAALEASLNLVTDLTGFKMEQGMMLP